MEEIVEEFVKSLGKTNGIYTKNDDIQNVLDIFKGSPWGQLICNIQPPQQPKRTKSTEGEKGNQFACVDIREMESYIAVIIDLPGVNKNSINLSITEDCVLKINVDRTNLYSNSSDSFFLKERYSGVINRSINLPKNIDKNTIRAGYVDGVLTVTLNKCSEVTSSKKILIH